jgi:tripartite tricarboxylate transporter TctB family protein
VITRRSLEIATALLTGAFGAAILVSSIALGVGWGRGVGTGTFPALAGALILAGSVYNLARGALAAGPVLLDGPRLRKVAAMFLPAAGFVALIPLLGLHAAAGVYVFVVVAAHRRLPLWQAAALGLATPFVLYSIFDWTFQVSLLRGLLGDAVGY